MAAFEFERFHMYSTPARVRTQHSHTFRQVKIDSAELHTLEMSALFSTLGRATGSKAMRDFFRANTNTPPVSVDTLARHTIVC